MVRHGEGKHYKATYGVCVGCETLFKHGDYTWADGMVFCESCRAKYDADTDLLKRVKYGGQMV